MKDYCEVCDEHGIETRENLVEIECGPIGTCVDNQHDGVHTVCEFCADEIKKSKEV